jgi:tetratricopeptide (TPR) repeat protein
MISGDVSASDAPEELCRAALPFEEERADPRRLGLLWYLIAHSAHSRMRNDESVAAFERALRYFRLAGDSSSSITVDLDWSMILSPRPADEGLRILDELAPGRPPGDGDLARAVLLAMLGRFDEAWPLAEARSDHLREATGSLWAEGYLAVIAVIEGDRLRACRHHADLIGALIPPGNEGLAATWRLPLARDLCYLGRFDEAERELRQARAVAAGPVERTLGPAVEALLLAARGELEQAEALARAGVAAAETETDNPWLQGWGYEDLAAVLERDGRIDQARDALERALAVWERKRCLPYVVRLREQIDSLARAEVLPAPND